MGYSMSLYERDFLAWTKKQSQLLKIGAFDKLDISNLIEEVDDMGKSEKRSLESYLVILIWHLLKVKFQPDMESTSWKNSIKESRLQVRLMLKKIPSLKSHIDTCFKEAYPDALKEAVKETGLAKKSFPKKCPWTLKEVLNGMEEERNAN
jgi:predicted DNA-binding ribbon-helix-helix protein